MAYFPIFCLFSLPPQPLEIFFPFKKQRFYMLIMRLPNFIKFRPKESLIFLHYHILQALQWSAILGPPSGVRQFIKTSENCVC